jgi:dihydrodipicolinate synthase/N-acetylneuraminate lyase
MLTAADVTGLLALPPSALKSEGEHLTDEDSLDLDEATRLAKQMIDDGAAAIGLCGTTGECATLLWDEKVALYRAVIDAVDGRVPVWCGTTALGTREVVRQMRVAKDLGAAAAFVGLPLWQTPTMENAVGFFADLGEAVPDLPVMVYANRFFFKFDFPVEFWEGIVAKAPTVIATKVGFPLTQEHLDTAGKQVNFMTGEGTIGMQYRMAPESVTAAWATSAAMGPEPWVAFLDAVKAGDDATAQQVLADIEGVPLPIPDFGDFDKYNIQLEKARINAAGYTHCGPPRAPYRDLPADWLAGAELNGKAWAEMRAKYVHAG